MTRLELLRRAISDERRRRLRNYERLERELEGYAERDCASGYTNPETGYRHGCRCDWCRAGTTDARKERRERPRAAA